ncbi:5-formyltetrahydrofolate cyclo-ligase [Propionicimonas paludicola]|uniref:5-formyltetrahydrofolate cyclo-ligase n=1 Tax=Propionicimonas paludicola TaxID=185243 RepID=A0A2A9CSP9_9ACTN|nr:5-formyltetrahydrofolate cyclo-ligase [Propionicimonas paludicola]PFG17444.1 5-formyltetrahydrofolate cyclo-ligase [Propionicimonas paludicola]
MQVPGSEGQPRAGVDPAKARLRATINHSRTTTAETAADSAARTARAVTACTRAEVVACYLSRPEEPDTAALIAALTSAGVRVLVPLLRREPDWAWFTGADDLVPGPHRIRQPRGTGLGGAALARADWIWLPGLAGTADGRRLGTGGGWYDRALGQARPDAVRGLLLFDREVLDDVPTQSWDLPVDLLVTERRTIRVRPE